MHDLFDWSYAPEREGLRLCSACGPTLYDDGSTTRYGQWHGKFDRTFLPLGMFKTNQKGNLAHVETGDEDFFKFDISPNRRKEVGSEHG
jgi:hypothetical protein